MSDLTLRKDRSVLDESRRSYLRLSGDMTRVLNNACKKRVDAGESQAALARAVDQDPAFLSRILSGAAGTNLRSIAAVLAATRHRLKIVAVPLEDLAAEATSKRALALMWTGPAIDMHKAATGCWIVDERVVDDEPREFARQSTLASIYTPLGSR